MSGAATGRAAATFAARLPLPTNRRLASLAYLRTRGAAAVIREAVSDAATTRAALSRAVADQATETRAVMRAVMNPGVVGHGVTMRAAAMSGLRRPV